MSKITVCELIRDFPKKDEITYGRTPNFYYICRELVKLGVDVHVICISKGKGDFYETFEGMHIHRTKFPYQLRIFNKLAELVKKYNVNIVHTYATSGVAYSFYKRFLGEKPLVVHVHHVKRGATGVPLFYSPINFIKNKFKDFTSSLRRNLIWKNADMLIAVSKAVANDLIEVYKIPTEKIQVVYNGVDTDVFKPLKTEEVAEKLCLKNKRVVLYVGDFGLRKGLKYLIRAVPQVVREIPDAAFLLIGGTPKWLGTDIYWQMLNEEIRRFDVSKFVTLMSSVPHFDLPKYYSLSEVFVLPSLYEGFGKVIIEAMACEKPVIATNVGGIPEIIDDGSNGVLVPPKNPDMLADAIIDLLSTRKKAKRMGTKGRKKVVERFTWRHTAENIVDIYKSLV